MMVETDTVREPRAAVAPWLRQTPRQRVLFAGILADPAARCSWRVTIRELSSRGAQVFLDPDLRVTDHPVLIIPRHGVAMVTRKVWQRAGLAGFDFRQVIGLARSATPEEHWLRELWLEADESPTVM
jgi:hypothetical protein